MENIKAGSVIILSLRSFGGFSNAKSAGFWGSAPDPDGGASSAPPYSLAGREGCPPPAPPRDGSAHSQPLPFSAPPPPPPPPTVQAGSASGYWRRKCADGSLNTVLCLQISFPIHHQKPSRSVMHSCILTSENCMQKCKCPEVPEDLYESHNG